MIADRFVSAGLEEGVEREEVPLWERVRSGRGEGGYLHAPRLHENRLKRSSYSPRREVISPPPSL